MASTRSPRLTQSFGSFTPWVKALDRCSTNRPSRWMEQRAELRRVISYLNAAVAMSPAIDSLSAANAVPHRTAEVPRSYYLRGARLAFQAIGDSMIEAGILDGDLLFVAPTRVLRDAAKRIVVCRLAGTTLVKKLELHAGRIRLLSRNERYAVIDVDEDDEFQLIGIVAGRLGSI
jgi:SOS-response transcriptional repressor LexA